MLGRLILPMRGCFLYGLCGAQSVLPQPEANVPQYVSHASWLQQV